MVHPAGRTHLGVQGPLLDGPDLPIGFSSRSVFRAKPDSFDRPVSPSQRPEGPQHGHFPRSDLRDFGIGIVPNLAGSVAEGFALLYPDYDWPSKLLGKSFSGMFNLLMASVRRR